VDGILFFDGLCAIDAFHFPMPDAISHPVLRAINEYQPNSTALFSGSLPFGPFSTFH
jgi:hypothetical protein